MLVVSRFTVSPADAADFAARARAALALFAAHSGHRRGWMARAVDAPDEWLFVTEWDGVGSYRRALSAYDVKVGAGPLLGLARAEPSAFEVLVTDDGTGPRTTPSGRAADADWVSVGKASAPQVPPA